MPSLTPSLKKVLNLDPIDSAKAAGLRYVSDEQPGIRRKQRGKSFIYFTPEGKPLKDPRTLKRIASLVIPPAYTDVWICPYANGHLQATGFDERGRKQYRYHPEWQVVRDETKFTRMIAFGRMLPQIRKKIQQDLDASGFPKEKVLATIARLLDRSMIRVGNEEYARENKSHGLTTMRNRHVTVTGTTLRFKFRGKKGIFHDIEVTDKRLAKIVRKLQDLPGQDLFQYLDESDTPQSISSADVNEYLKEISETDLTAKDFRTWWGSVIAYQCLCNCAAVATKKEAKKNITSAVKEAANHLGNTPAICRKCYVHPAISEYYLKDQLVSGNHNRTQKSELKPEELALLGFLERVYKESASRLSQ